VLSLLLRSPLNFQFSPPWVGGLCKPIILHYGALLSSLVLDGKVYKILLLFFKQSSLENVTVYVDDCIKLDPWIAYRFVCYKLIFKVWHYLSFRSKEFFRANSWAGCGSAAEQQRWG
jgi:hypothetical protein